MPSINGFLQLALCLKTGDGYAGSLTILVGSAGLDYSIDVISVALGILQPFQDEDANAISYNDAISSLIEWSAFTCRRQHPSIVHGDKSSWMGINRDSARDCKIDIMRL